jgi:diguanylate cyclase (GGDEF)-like protein
LAEQAGLLRNGPIRVFACCLALSAGLQAQEYVFHPYRQFEGLGNMSIKGVTTDRNGFLWMGTENGAYRFLGSRFEKYGQQQGILDRDIQDIYADPNGTVWAGTDEDLYRWDGASFLPAGKNPIHVEDARHIAALDQRNLLVIDGSLLYRLEHDAQGAMLSYTAVFSAAQIASMPELGNLTSITVVGGEPGNQMMWAGCGNKLCSWPVGSPESVTQWGSGAGVVETHWHSVVLDRAGTLWAAGDHEVAVLLHGATRFVDRDLPDADTESVSRQMPMIEDREGRVLIPSRDGIARWEGTHWRLIGSANGLRSNHITGMAIDSAGDLWFGSLGRGLYHWIGYENWEGWGDGQGLPSSVVWAVLPYSDDRVFVGTEEGTGWIDPQTGAAGRLFQGSSWSFGQVSTMGADRDGSVWAGTFSGYILRIDPRSGQTQMTAHIPTFVLTSFQDSKGRIFLTTKAGLYMTSANVPGSAPQRVTALDPLLGNLARVEKGCETANGDLWFLGANRLVRLRGDQWSAPQIDGLPKLRGSLLSLSCASNNVFWVTGDDGTWRLTLNGDRLQAWTLEVPADLRTLAPLAIEVDKRGWVWLGTDSGMVVWNGSRWRHLNQESGLIWNDVDQGGLSLSQDGSMWIGTSGGLTHLLHPEQIFQSSPVTASITSIRRGDASYSGGNEITLPWASVPLRFQISSPAMRNRSELVFRYRMEGLQPDWIEATDGVAAFAGLSPGEYTFEAMAQNTALDASSTPVFLRVKILPPWWRNDWFYLACVVGFLLFMMLGDQVRVRHLRAKSRELENVVRKRTQELEDSREQLRIQATHDGLTGLFNRVAVLRALSAEIDRARRKGSFMVVALVDLDHFKRVNDAYGHLAGDEALRWFAAAVAAAIRPYDHAGRYGGEEFLLVLNDIPPEVVEPRLASLHASISNLQVHTRDTEFSINCSLGATVFNPLKGPAAAEALLAVADQALYAAKATGRNRVVLLESNCLDDHGSAKILPPV